MKRTRTPARQAKPATPKLKAAVLPLEVHSDIIRQLTGFDEAALRRLAAKGVIPRPKISKWPFAETISKLCAHLNSQLSTRAAQLPVYDSMDACEGAGLFSKKFLQTLKAFGLPGFENTRVDFNQLLPQLEPFLAGTSESQAELQRESVATWAEFRQKYQALIAKLEHEEALGLAISKETAVATVRELQTIHHHSYGRMIEEWPAVLAGLAAAAVRAHIAHFVEGLKGAEENSISALEKAKGKRGANLKS